MKRFIASLALVFIGLNSIQAQTDASAKLKEELVTISNGKYQIEDFQLLTFSNDATLQLKTTATAPEGVISRDQFVAIYSSVGVFMIVSILGEAGVSIDDVDFKELDELIGVADISIHLEMTKNGLQMAITTEEGTERETITWNEFFADN